MHYFPAFLDLRGRICLVAGAGRVGSRKIARLLDCGPALLRVVDPSPDSTLEAELRSRPSVELIKRAFRPDDLEGAFLVIAGTADARINTEISRLCRQKNILCNIVDQPELCSFIVPALLQRDDLLIAVSSQGASPALARRIRTELEERFGPEYAAWLKLLRCLRPLVVGLGRSSESNKDVFRALTDQEILERLRAGDGPGLREAVKRCLPEELHSQVEDCLHELV